MTLRSMFVALMLVPLAQVGIAAGPMPAASSNAGTTVAIVTRAQGNTQLLVGAQRRQVDVLTEMPANSVVELDESAQLVVAYSLQGHVFELTGPGRFRVLRDAVVPVKNVGDGIAKTAAGRVQQRQLAAAFRDLQVKPMAVVQASTTVRNLELRGFQLLHPKGVQSSADVRLLRWHPVQIEADKAQAWSYRVQLTNDDGYIVFETETMESEARLPDNLQLERGRPYVWTVTALGPYHRKAEAQALAFTLIDERVDQALQEAQRLAKTDDTGRVLLELARRQYGLNSGQ